MYAEAQLAGFGVQQSIVEMLIDQMSFERADDWAFVKLAGVAWVSMKYLDYI